MATLLLALMDSFACTGFNPSLLYIGTVLIDLAMWEALSIKWKEK
jgi:hypothetical protein